MSTFGNAVLGLVFLFLAVANTVLMFKLWGYPFDHAKLRSSAPPWLMLVHRLTGYLFLGIYVYMMWQMFPRLWNYQVELPARTVAHLVLGMSIGVILLVKIAIVRFFKYLESSMAPFLGTALLICTVVLIGLSVPIAIKEAVLGEAAVRGTMSAENMGRVRGVLANTTLASHASVDELSSRFSLEQGRAVLLNKCVQCHDLRTVLVKPRAAESWIQIVERMAERAILDPITEKEQQYVAAYLISISPQLQRSVRQQREQQSIIVQARMTSSEVLEPPTKRSSMPPLDLSESKTVFEATCSQCHSLRNVEFSPPGSEQEARELVASMIEEGLNASRVDLEKIIYYLTATYAK